MPKLRIGYQYRYLQLYAVKYVQKRFGLRKYQISTGLNYVVRILIDFNCKKCMVTLETEYQSKYFDEMIPRIFFHSV